MTVRLSRLTAITIAVAALAAIVLWQPGATAPTARAVGEQCVPSKPWAAGTTVQTMTTPTGTRSYRLHVPASYTGADPVPLVFAFHGAGSSALEQEVYSAFSTKSDAEGFVVVYPDGPLTNIPFEHFNAWQLPVPPEHDDVALTSAIIDRLIGQLCLDQSRVYSTGMSNGAMMSVRLACSLSSRIAAIAPVAGSYFPAMATNVNPAENCPDVVARPFLAFHGTADATVPFNGGVPASGSVNYRLPIDDDTPADDVLASWAAHNGCTGPRTETTIDTEVVLVEYGSCTNGVATRLYVVDPGGHSWPGSFFVASLGYVTQQINATNLIWEFFENYTLPDADADLIPDNADNCPADADFSQLNSDGNAIDNPSPIGVDDTTRASSDLSGDVCDLDDDNDGFPDATELTFPAMPGCPSATGPLNPAHPDTDGDATIDSAECAIGTNPNSSASEPTQAQCAVLAGAGIGADTDGDKLMDRIEVCGYNTSPAITDSDGDGRTDGCEGVSVNNQPAINSIDQLLLAQAIIADLGGPPIWNIDLNKDGANNSADQLLMAFLLFPTGQCA